MIYYDRVKQQRWCASKLTKRYRSACTFWVGEDANWFYHVSAWGSLFLKVAPLFVTFSCSLVFIIGHLQCLTWKLSCMQHRHALHGSPFCIKGKSCAFRCSISFLTRSVFILSCWYLLIFNSCENDLQYDTCLHSFFTSMLHSAREEHGVV